MTVSHRIKSEDRQLALAYHYAAGFAGISSLREMAEASGLSLRAVFKISRGRGDPKLSTIRTLCQACGIEVSEFYRYYERATRTKTKVSVSNKDQKPKAERKVSNGRS